MMLNQKVRLALVEAQSFETNGQEGERAEERTLDHRWSGKSRHAHGV